MGKHYEKRMLFDWDAILSLSTAERCHSFTEQEKEALKMLWPQIEWSTRWLNADNHNIDDIESFIGNLSYKILNDGDCQSCEDGDCEAYDNSASFITYSPQNPFSEPDLVPSGYLTPPFTRFAEFPLIGWLSQWLPDFTEELTGYLPNDVIVDISSIPTGSWTEPALGMPQIAIEVSGNGTVELHMLNFPLGGRAIVTIDSQPNIGDILGGIIGNSEFIIELNRDLLSVPPENVPVTIYEIEIDDEIPTNHTIYITFAPTVDDSLIPINFGGGIRKVVLCGLDTQIMPIVEDVRINQVTCKLETMINGQWIESGDINQCVTDVTNPMQAEIADHETRLSQAEISIQQHNLDISDHETRITTLENTGGGGGGGSVIGTTYHVELTANTSANYTQWVEAIAHQHNFTYKTVLLIIEAKVYAFPSGYARLRARISDGVNDVAVGANEAWNWEQEHTSTQISQNFELPQTGNLTIHVDVSSSDVNGALMRRNQNISIAIFEFGEAVTPQSETITFDAGGAPYQLLAGPSQVGTVQGGGNPDNALVGGCNAGEFIGIWYDNSGSTIQDINLDMYLNDKNVFRLQIHADQVLIYDQPMDFAGQSNVWFNHRVSDYNGSLFPISPSEVEIRIVNPSGGSTTARMDNVEIEVQ